MFIKSDKQLINTDCIQRIYLARYAIDQFSKSEENKIQISRILIEFNNNNKHIQIYQDQDDIKCKKLYNKFIYSLIYELATRTDKSTFRFTEFVDEFNRDYKSHETTIE